MKDSKKRPLLKISKIPSLFSFLVYSSSLKHYLLQARNLNLQVEQETQKRNLLQNDIKTHCQQITQLKSSQKQLNKVSVHGG